MEAKKVYKTIRIYELDHNLLLKEFSKSDDFAEIIHIILNKYLRKEKE